MLWRPAAAAPRARERHPRRLRQDHPRSLTTPVRRHQAKDINTAYERINSSDVRYRFVIDAATFAKPSQA